MTAAIFPRFKKSLPHSLGKRIHFCWKRITAGELPAFPTVLHLATLVKKRQYHLSWNGGSGAGEKTSGVLRIAEAGKKLQTILLDKLLIEDIDGMYYNIHFQKDEKTGTLLLSK